MNTILIKCSILIKLPLEKVWDYTQDYGKRKEWDKKVIRATVIQSTPNRVVDLYFKGNTRMTFVYKLDRRPEKTTLVAEKIQSSLLVGAGGSWSYEFIKGETLWTQVNSLELKHNILLRLLAPILEWVFRWQTKQAMGRAKKILEKNNNML